MDNPFKKAGSAITGLDDPIKAWIVKEIHRGEIRGELRLLNLELELSKLAQKSIEEKIAALQAALDGEL